MGNQKPSSGNFCRHSALKAADKPSKRSKVLPTMMGKGASFLSGYTLQAVPATLSTARLWDSVSFGRDITAHSSFRPKGSRYTSVTILFQASNCESCRAPWSTRYPASCLVGSAENSTSMNPPCAMSSVARSRLAGPSGGPPRNSSTEVSSGRKQNGALSQLLPELLLMKRNFFNRPS